MIITLYLYDIFRLQLKHWRLILSYHEIIVKTEAVEVRQIGNEDRRKTRGKNKRMGK
jgi:hypothetical protein